MRSNRSSVRYPAQVRKILPEAARGLIFPEKVSHTPETGKKRVYAIQNFRQTMKLRVAIVADDLYPGFGGQAAATEGHIEALLALGHEVRVLAGAERKPTVPPPGVMLDRLPVWRPGDKQTHLAIPEIKRIPGLLDWADVVQANTPTPLVYRTLGLARNRGVPSVAGFHSQEESATLHFSLTRPLVEAALRAWFSRLYKRPDCLTAPTPFAARLVHRYTDRPVHVVSNGIRLPQDEAKERREGSSLRRRLLPEGRFLFAYVGRLAREKDPRSMIELMASLAGSRRDAVLAVAGTGPLRHTLERQAGRLGLAKQVRFLGYVSEEYKHALLRASDLFIMPSPTELQSIATLEAMVRGCAVVATDSESSAVGEMVREADCGLRYRPERLGDGARRIGRLLDRPDELESLQKNAAAAARQHDVNESGRRLEGIYHSLLDAHPNGVTVESLERNKS